MFFFSKVMADFNAEIAQEMEAAAAAAAANAVCEAVEEASSVEIETKRTEEEYGIGVGEVSIEFFDINQLHILRDEKEKLIKVCNSMSIIQNFKTFH